MMLWMIGGWIFSACGALSGDFESPPTLQAPDLAPADVALEGDLYQVDDDVPTDGFLATFTIRSDFGRIEARGPGMLKVRISEIEALDSLSKVEKSEVFMNSLKKSASGVGQAVANVVTNPVETAKAVPASVGRFLERTARAAKTGVHKLTDVKEGREAGAPREAEEGKELAVSDEDKSQSVTQNLAVATGVAAARATRDILGYDEKRRDLARQLNVDPYTTNPLLSKKLDEIAWAAFAGGLGVDTLVAAVPGGRLVKSTSVMNDWIYEKSPGDLSVWMEKTLQEIGVAQDSIDLFLRHKAFNMTLQLMLVMALDRMSGVDGRSEVIETAVTAENFDQAYFLANGFCMLAREHEDAPLREIIGGRPVAITKTGRALATMSLDYVSWSSRVEAFVNREDLIRNQPRLVLAGRLSDRTRTELEARGWAVVEQAPGCVGAN